MKIKFWSLTASLCASSLTAQAETFCFYLEPAAGRPSAWCRHHYIIQTPDVSTVVNGRAFRPVYGVGWNEAPTPYGSVDLVPLTGAAARDVTGEWVVSLIGTLDQYSQPGLTDLYYLISESWRLQPDLSTGTAYIGNLHKPFVGGRYPDAGDDSERAVVYRVDCAAARSASLSSCPE